MGSASQPMLVVKANRALLRKRKSFKDVRESYVGYVREAKLEFKKLTPFEQKKIKDKIRAQAKRNRLHELKTSLISLFILVLIIFGVYLLLR